MSVIGLDIGTTGCKALVFGREWEILGRASREYPVLSPCADWAEQDAEQVWKLALEALAQAAEQGRADPPRAMALSVQGEAVIPVDRKGRSLRNAILGMDTRSTAENAWLAETFDPQRWWKWRWRHPSWTSACVEVAYRSTGTLCPVCTWL